MAAIRVNEEEQSLLGGLRGDLVKLYVMLRARMDYASALAGAGPGKRISWEMLREMMYVEPGQGMERSGKPTLASVRRQVAALERAGLIERPIKNLPRQGHLVLSFPFATADQFATNKPGKNPARKLGKQPGNVFYLTEQQLTQQPGKQPGNPDPPKPGKHPVSGKDRLSPDGDNMSGKPDASAQARQRKKAAKAILAFLNDKAGRAYQPVSANLSMIEARLKEGATEMELRQVVAKKTREWATDERMSLYLRPATLFNRTKFAQYQGELVVPEDDHHAS